RVGRFAVGGLRSAGHEGHLGHQPDKSTAKAHSLERNSQDQAQLRESAKVVRSGGQSHHGKIQKIYPAAGKNFRKSMRDREALGADAAANRRSVLQDFQKAARRVESLLNAMDVR